MLTIVIYSKYHMSGLGDDTVVQPLRELLAFVAIGNGRFCWTFVDQINNTLKEKK